MITEAGIYKLGQVVNFISQGSMDWQENPKPSTGRICDIVETPQGFMCDIRGTNGVGLWIVPAESILEFAECPCDISMVIEDMESI